MRKIRPHMNYANVMVTILAFIVLGGGTALASAQLGKNSVGFSPAEGEIDNHR